MKRLSNQARVLVCDGAHAVLLRNEGDAAFPNLRKLKDYDQGDPATRDLGTDRPGRTNDAAGRRSAMEPTDLHQQAEDRFIQALAADMAKDLAAGEFDSLVVVAPPVALGAFRKCASAALAKSILLEINKDLTRHPVDQIEKIVAKALEEASFER